MDDIKLGPEGVEVIGGEVALEVHGLCGTRLDLKILRGLQYWKYHICREDPSRKGQPLRGCPLQRTLLKSPKRNLTLYLPRLPRLPPPNA